MTSKMETHNRDEFSVYKYHKKPVMAFTQMSHDAFFRRPVGMRVMVCHGEEGGGVSEGGGVASGVDCDVG